MIRCQRIPVAAGGTTAHQYCIDLIVARNTADAFRLRSTGAEFAAARADEANAQRTDLLTVAPLRPPAHASVGC
jgi:hypothetical protein